MFCLMIIWLLSSTFLVVRSSPIIGGINAEENEFPSIVSIRDERNEHFCGGAIIAEDFILTAYHCLHHRDFKKVSVVAGTISTKERPENCVFNIKRVFHYNNKKWLRIVGDTHDDRHDLMILELAEKIPLTNRTKIAILPKSAPRPGTRIELAGWGYTKEYKTAKGRMYAKSDVLKKITVTVDHNSNCKRYANNPTIGFFEPYEMCVNNIAGQGVCYGDSGSPLIKDGVLIGIALWSHTGCALGKADFFANVYAYRDFIQPHIPVCTPRKGCMKKTNQ